MAGCWPVITSPAIILYLISMGQRKHIIPPSEFSDAILELPISNVLMEMAEPCEPPQQVIEPDNNDQLIDIPKSEKPTHPMGYKERKQWGIDLRAQALRLRELADRIDPEHRTLVLLGAKDMSEISAKWTRAKQVLESQKRTIERLKLSNLDNETRVTKLSANVTTLEEQVSEIDNLRRTHLKQLEEMRLANAELRDEVARSTAIIESVKSLIGGLPDEADRKAIQEMGDITVDSEEEESK